MEILKNALCAKVMNGKNEKGELALRGRGERKLIKEEKILQKIVR